MISERMSIIPLASPAMLDRYLQPAEWPPVQSADLAAQLPDATWLVVVGNAAVARASAWWTSVPQIAGQTSGAMGHFAASDRDAALAVLDTACSALRGAGVTLALGPMDGNTWRRYRLVIESGGEPPFFLEPTNPPQWPQWFADAGWRIHSEYVSSINDTLSRIDPAGPEKAKAIAERGIVMRDLRIDDYDAELRRIYAVARVSFASAYLYTLIDEDEFVAQYAAARPAVVPSLVTIAEHEGRPIGFCFCLPDLNERLSG